MCCLLLLLSFHVAKVRRFCYSHNPDITAFRIPKLWYKDCFKGKNISILSLWSWIQNDGANITVHSSTRIYTVSCKLINCLSTMLRLSKYTIVVSIFTKYA